MTLKEQLEILRGEPIRVFTGDPMDIPCIETSDAERLCKNPVVSVDMITYNHEPYIRQAIEGVMMQKTDFEFELVIGEDCSTDRTREICFEYQKRYPDKIRVLWCDHNLYRNPHPAGGNSARNRAHCRGEFIAFCEGDDYWTDPLKLQKQIKLLRETKSVFCFTDYAFANDSNVPLCIKSSFFSEKGLVEDFFKQVLRGSRVGTLTAVMRKDAYELAKSKFEILSYRLSLGDYQLWLSLSMMGGVCCLNEETAIHRVTTLGASVRLRSRLRIDSNLINIYFSKHAHNLSPKVSRMSALKIVESRIADGASPRIVAAVGGIKWLGAFSWSRAACVLIVRLTVMWYTFIVFGPADVFKVIRRRFNRD